MTPSRQRRGRAAAGCWLLLAVWSQVAWAQRFPVRHYTVDDGLPSGQVRDIAQGPDGRMWFATRSGVAVYDGRSWRVFNLAHGFLGADQLALARDDAGALWSLGARAPHRLYRFEDPLWRPIVMAENGPAPSRVHAFAVLGAGEEAIPVVAGERGLFWGAEGRWRLLRQADGLPATRVVALERYGDALLVATPRGLITVRGGRPEPGSAIAAPNGRAIAGLAVERPRRGGAHLWVAGEDWVGKVEGGNVAVLADALPLTPLETFGRLLLEPDRRGGVYLGNARSLAHFHPLDGVRALGRANGLLADGATDLFLDREAVLWLGSRGGVGKLVGRALARYGREEGLFSDEVTAVHESADGTLIFGHRGGLSVFADDRVVAVRALPAAASRVAAGPGVARVERVWDLAEDAAGELWIAAGSDGLGRLPAADAAGGEIGWYGAESGIAGTVTAVLAHRDGELYVGTDRGLLRRAGERFVPVDATRGLHVRRLLSAMDRALVLATDDGLHRIPEEGGGMRTWRCAARTSCNSVFAVLERPDGSFWAGTAAGLYRARVDTRTAADADADVDAGADAELERVVVRGPRIDRPIYFMVVDGRARVWLGTDNGVLRWDSERLRAFTVRDGLAGRETYRAAGLVDRRDRVWIGTEAGVTRYREPRGGAAPPPPIVELYRAEASGEPLALDGELKLGYRQDDLVFHFRAISFLDEDRVRVRTRLESFEDGWTELPPKAAWVVRYTNVPAGRYRLLVQAANVEGAWSEVGSTPEITIRRPSWQQPWFFLLVAGALALLTLSGERLISQRRYARTLEAEVERRVAEVVTEKERLTVTLRNIDDGVITADGEGRIIFLNPTAQALTGWSAEQAVGEPLRRVLRMYRGAGNRERYDPFALLGARDIETLERVVGGELEARDGERRAIELSGSPIVHSRGRHAGLVLAFRDITEKRKIELELAKAQKLEALGLLAGGIAHDFNNLLTVMLGSLAMIEQVGGLDRHQGKLLGDAQNAVLRARDLTRQLLTFARGGTPVRAAASIAEVIHESSSFVLSGSNVRAEIELADDLWTVEIDAGQISQVLNNLLINATQAMPEGGRLRIAAANALGATVGLPHDRYVAIAISDHGVGIPPEHLDRIFDPYFSTKEKGRGLGLASAYSIAKQHDGTLRVESKLGEGTVFRLFLPASRAPLPERPRPVAAPAGSGERVLIMDDDDAVLGLTATMVESQGFEVVATRDGAAAIAAYREAAESGRPFALVIMDLTIPGGMGGKEAIARLREYDPGLRAVVASGYSNDPVMADHRRYGFRGRISKPFRPDELATVLAQALAEPPAPS